MTLRSKTIVISVLTVVVICFYFYSFRQYRSANDNLVRLTVLLGDIRYISARVELIVNNNAVDLLSLERAAQAITHIADELQELWQLDTKPRQLLDLQAAVLRIHGAADLTLHNARFREHNFAAQIKNELRTMEVATEELKKFSHARLGATRDRAETITLSINLLLIGTVVGLLLSMFSNVIRPIMLLSRQVEEMRQGARNNLEPTGKNDEIGLLNKFVSSALAEIKNKNEELATSRENLKILYQHQLSITKILELSVTTETMEELLQGTLKIIFSLDWLKIQAQGGIFLVDPGPHQRLILKCSINFTEPILHQCAVVAFGHCLCGKAALSRELIHGEATAREHEATHDGMPAHAHYCVPILFNEELLGVMTLYLAAGRGPRADEIEYLQGVSNILAQAIMRRRLEERHILISAAVEQAEEGVVMTDKHGVIIYSNPSLTRLTGCRAEEIIGQPLQRMINRGSQEVVSQLEHALAHGVAWEGVLANEKKDGARFEEKMTMAPVRDRQGEVVNFVVTKKDITREKNLESQLLHAQKLEAVGTLAGGVAHDFNNILTSIIGYCELLLMDLPVTDPNRDKVRTILGAGERATTLIQQLLLFSRKQNFTMSCIDLNCIIENTVKMLRRLIGEDVELKVTARKNIGKIKADQGQMEQVLMNLAINARDAMPRGGVLAIETAAVRLGQPRGSTLDPLPPGDYLQLLVSDTGVGMSSQVKARIFEPFFTTKGVGKGTGLGLATVYGIVKQHKGHIDIESEPGQGTKFSIYFPVVAKSDGEAAASLGKCFELVPFGREVIMVVDDDSGIRNLVAETLRSLGYHVLVASNGQEALHLLENWQGGLDLLLTDVVMPGMTGMELASVLKRREPALKVILMSGYMNRAGRVEEAIFSRMKCISKPLVPTRLCAIIREFLDAPAPLAGRAAAPASSRAASGG